MTPWHYTIFVLGVEYDLKSGKIAFNLSKSFGLGAQALVGIEAGFNSDTYRQVIQ